MAHSTSIERSRRIPLNLFGMAFGLAGLGGSWLAAARYGLASAGVGDTILAVASVVWATTVGVYGRYVLSSPGALSADLADTVAAPFASLAVITPILLAAEGVAPHALIAGRVLVDIFVVLTVVLGGWFTGRWMHGPLDIDRLHPGYFLPTVAGGLVASLGAALVGQHRLAEVMFGLGLICWFILGSMILARLFFRPALPAALLPTLAIEVAPAAVASLAYFAIDGDRIDIFAAGIAGYGLLMVLAQIPLLPQYRTLPFAASTWAFTFGWAAVATATLGWIELGQPTGRQIYAYVVLTAITVLVGGIAARTLVALVRHQLIPTPVSSPSTPGAAPSSPARVNLPAPVTAAARSDR